MIHREMKSDGDSRIAVLTLSNDYVTTGRPGRPKVSISETALRDLRELGYKWKEIAKMLMVSRWTIYRRVKELNLEDVTGYSKLTDEELDQKIAELKKSAGPLAGRSMAIGFLKAQGLSVQQQRVAKSLVRVDPISSRIRWACVIKRRKYCVPGPNSLWHIDGHHSLIRLGFVIHGGIDGYSRLTVFLKCSTNNYQG